MPHGTLLAEIILILHLECHCLFLDDSVLLHGNIHTHFHLFVSMHARGSCGVKCDNFGLKKYRCN